MSSSRFASPAEVSERLAANGYLADAAISNAVFLADRLEKPVLAEGPAGTGKTELAKAVARATGSNLIRLQCYEGLDEAKALYEWNYKKQLLRIQAGTELRSEGDPWEQMGQDLFSEEFLLARPLLQAIRATEPVVLLIDEVDRVEIETEALMLEVLSDYQVSVPELGTVRAATVPMVFLTSNGTRQLSEALKRRCLFCYVDYPDAARERDIILSQLPGIPERLAAGVADVVQMLREMGLKKSPSVSETLDWARTLMLLGREEVDDRGVEEGLAVMLKNRADLEKAAGALATAGAGVPPGSGAGGMASSHESR